MKLSKIINKLSDIISEGLDPEGHNCEDFQGLLSKLEKKKLKLEKKLADTKNAGKRKKIKLEIRIVRAQLKKGEELNDKRCS